MKKILNLNKYYYDDYKYKEINSIQNLFKSSIDKSNNYFNTKLFIKTHHTLLYTLFISINNKQITRTIYTFFSKKFYRATV